VALIGAGLVHRPATSGPTAVIPAASGVVIGADGIPTQIDGQRVYRVDDKAEWQDLSGSFLLGGYTFREMANCPALPQPLPSPEADLAYTCGGVGIGPAAGSNATSGGLMLATLGSTALDAWVDGPAIVVRVHTQDPEAAGCSADQRAGCAAAIVTEAVVWPHVPTELAGERVYRATDQASFAGLKGSFLLGGHVTKPSVIPPCPMPIDKTAAEQQLIPYCYWLSIDGLAVAPMSNLDEPNNEVVVARVHVNDPLAAQCPASARAVCEAGIVVEEIVWTSGPQAPGSAEPSPSNPVSTITVPPSSASPGSIGPLGADGIPTTVNGQTVYRGVNLPDRDLVFLLGGRLELDKRCATTDFVGPCPLWVIDGVSVRFQTETPESIHGRLAVVSILRTHGLSDCVSAICPPTETLVVTRIVWSGPAVPEATPLAPLPPAS
jgi:hypothetical protein